MDSFSSRNWLRTLGWCFLAGFALLGLTDFFHTATGVQKYLIDLPGLMLKPYNWPLYLPVQMGLITTGAGLLWALLFNLLVQQRLKMKEDEDRQPLGKGLVPVTVLMIIAGFFLGWVTLGYEYHLSLYLVFYILSLVIVSLFFSRYYLLAFLLVGLSGPLAEWLLLAPSVGYYEFVQKDLFGRVPGWQLFAYGWGGLFFHFITRPVRKY